MKTWTDRWRINGWLQRFIDETADLLKERKAETVTTVELAEELRLRPETPLRNLTAHMVFELFSYYGLRSCSRERGVSVYRRTEVMDTLSRYATDGQ